MAALQLADRFRLIERTGVALMVIAVGVFVGAWWATRWISRQTLAKRMTVASLGLSMSQQRRRTYLRLPQPHEQTPGA